MDIEIEAKMRLSDRAGMIKRLERAGARRVGRLKEVNIYFDTAAGDLKSADQGLRVRRVQEQDGSEHATITHKGPRAFGRLKSRAEREVDVSDARRAADLLGALGYFPVLTFEKRRERWELDGCRVELDTLPLLGDFIEIEGPDDETVLAVRKKLGLEETPMLRASYIAIMMSHIREQKLDTRIITFEGAEDGDAAPEAPMTTTRAAATT